MVRSINRIAEFFNHAARREKLVSPEMVQKTKAVRHPAHKIFEVQSAATGDGVYNCYAQKLLSDEWDDTEGDDKFDDSDTISVEILNLAEYNAEPTYVAHLAVGDLLIAWREADNEDNMRWVGVPFREGAHGGHGRIAYCKNDAGASNQIICYLDQDDDPGPAGTEITVTCNISGGGDHYLNEAERRLECGDPILVEKIGTQWYAKEGFSTTEDCDCYEAP